MKAWIINLCLLTLFSLQPCPVLAGNLTSLDDLFQGQLANLSWPAPVRRPPGKQDFGYCCRLAVNDSLEIVNGTAQFIPGQPHLVGTIDDFLRNPFPCDYNYEGGPGYPPQVYITYGWCHSNCPGYSMTPSGRRGLSSWLKPLVLFIVPSAVFSLNVPRRRRINVPSRMFPDKFSSVWSLVSLTYKVPISAVIVTLDILIWNVVIMTFAGPMMLSGLYEALLDRKIMQYLRRKMSTRSLTVQQRAHLLLVVLYGCLDLGKAWDITVDLVQGLPMDNLRRRKSSAQLPAPETLLGFFGSVGSNEQSFSNRRMTRMVPAVYPAASRSNIERVKLKLRSALETQISFGSAAGAAVVFYCGNFAYALLELQADYGRVTIAHSLAFGVMWTVIPHVAIVCNLVLGCKNPFFLYSTISKTTIFNEPFELQDDSEPAEVIKATHSAWYSLWTVIYPPCHMTDIKSAWVWNRGHNKRLWMTHYSHHYPNISRSVDRDILTNSFKSVVCSVFVPTGLLIVTPAFLGGMISYTTPSTGLGCRSLTLLVYAGAECLLTLLWAAKVFRWHECLPLTGRLFGGKFDHIGWILSKALWKSAVVFNTFVSFFTGVIGTAFIISSFYNNCLCATPARFWPHRWRSDAVCYMSQTSTEQVRNAQIYWIPAAIGATCLLAATSYLGWWFSNLMRDHFKACTFKIDAIDEEDVLENGSSDNET